jgi:hypothetical protein
MPLNYNFINQVDPAVEQEINRRSSAYWPDRNIDDASLAWNYQKTAYLILRSIEFKTSIVVTRSTNVVIDRDSGLPEVLKDLTDEEKIFEQNILRTTSLPEYKLPGDGTTTDQTIIKSKIITKEIQAPVDPILQLYDATGTIQYAILNSAEITSDGTYGSILRSTVNFTVFDKDKLDDYVNNFLRPGVDIELEYGWTVNDNINVNKGKIQATVYNFNFSSKPDGSWDCTLNALGPSSMTYGFGIPQTGTTSEDIGLYSTTIYGKGLLDILKTLSTNTDYYWSLAHQDISNIIPRNNKAIKLPSPKLYNITGYADPLDYNDVIFYLYALPIDVKGGVTTIYHTSGADPDTGFSVKEVAETILAYISLENLVKLINNIIKQFSTREIPLYDSSEVIGNGYTTSLFFTGPADFKKFAFATQINGLLTLVAKPAEIKRSDLMLNFKIAETNEFYFPGTADVDLSKLILFNVDFISKELENILSNDKNIQNKKIISFLNNLFDQLETDTGGIISLTIVDGQKDINGKIQTIKILNNNGAPTKELNNIKVLTLPAVTKGSVVRNLSIESSVPDQIQAEVATFTRAGLTYMDRGDNEVDYNYAVKSLDTLIENLKEIDRLGYFLLHIRSDDTKATNSTAADPKRRGHSDNWLHPTDMLPADIWPSSVRNIYRKIYSLTQNQILNGNGSRISNYNNVFLLPTAIFPIKLKVTLDGIEGFNYGNSITTNWLPKQYRKTKDGRPAPIYWTVVKIRHIIQNNDWSTELETIYRIKS